MSELEEIWKPVNFMNFGEVFQVSNLGNMRKIFYHVHNREPKTKYPKVYIRNDNRCYFSMYYKGVRIKRTVHRLVALTFIPNPNNHPVINHIDGNPLNNKIDNLEWCTYSYNTIDGFKRGRKIVMKRFGENKNSKGKVVQKDLQGNIIKIYSCQTETKLFGFLLQHVGKVINGERKTHRNFKWELYEQK